MPAKITIEYSADDIIARMQQLHDRLGGDGIGVEIGTNRIYAGTHQFVPGAPIVVGASGPRCVLMRCQGVKSEAQYA